MKKTFILLLSSLFATFACYDSTEARPPVKRTATLSWTAPSTYTDGTPISLSSISNYNVYYGTTTGGPYSYKLKAASYPTSINISIPSRGVWYFVVTTVDIQGKESGYSNQVSKSF